MAIVDNAFREWIADFKAANPGAADSRAILDTAQYAFAAGRKAQREIDAARQPVESEENVAADTYWTLAEMIEPHVQREGINPDGALPASVHDSVAILLEHWLRTRQPVDSCTESECKRCRAHPDHRGSLEHAGISDFRQPVGAPVAVVTTSERFVYGKLNRDLPDGTNLYAAPAQAVDLGSVRDVFRRWHANELNSTDAMLALVEALAVIDSHAVGK